ncbi:TraB/GumN family protein [Flavobacterium sp. KACC 22761]|uniref:TraB/GumN family protein n=1 Tax=Flavobacterium sp. KACC 22761 TaxID=3092665 RepID=UPI002A7521D1|nr:TraB/GumN family protein [Flavobacterium sp. KACC 22761]WPO79911.1 TraB/GumN family protein [Flavobacterium sp. KACC 22761]
MKNLITSVIALITLVFSSSAQAQTKSPKLENSLLWEVSGNGLSKPSYVYGTIHSICPTDYFLSEKTKNAFEKSEKLIVEINFFDPNEMADVQKLALSSEPLSKKLTPEQFSKLDLVVQKTAGLKLQLLDNYSLATIMSLISMKAFDCETLKSYEMEFMTLAKSKNKEIAGFETVKGQLNTLSNAYSDDELIATMEDINKEETKKMVQDYKDENLLNLYDDTASEKEMSSNTKKWMLDDRNKDWVQKMSGMMKKESLFVAVGSAHLVGEQGVLYLLRKAGYIVKPIMN